ncbi:MAG: hypothetical protein MRK02_10190 [Candidatus Scalindua sp.]|nr:hypothetical protein [Candidatus Scalindua sp.]
MKSQYTKHLKVRTIRKLKSSLSTCKADTIGYVRAGDYYYASYADWEIVISNAMLPKTRGNKWSQMGLCNGLAKECVEILEEIEEMPKFLNLDNYNYILPKNSN